MNIPTPALIVIISALVTSVLILILAYAFRDRISEIRFFTARLIFFKPEEIQAEEQRGREMAKEETKTIKKSNVYEWNKTATLFWLGNDLMWVLDLMYRGLLPRQVLGGVNIAKQYFTDLGFEENSFPHKRLNMATTYLESQMENTGKNEAQRQILKNNYSIVAKYITEIKWFISRLAEQEQPDFKQLSISDQDFF